jgi:hypothetical protein
MPKLSHIRELGELIVNIDNIIKVEKLDGDSVGFGIVMLFDKNVPEILAYTSKSDRDRNFLRMESWLHEFSQFFTIQEKIINIDKILFARRIGNTVLFNVSGVDVTCQFKDEEEAKKIRAEVVEVLNAKSRL